MNSADRHKESGLDQVLKTKMPALGIDLGGTKILAALVHDLKLASEPKRIPTPHGAAEILDALVGLIEDFQKDHLIAGVGIATAGIVNIETGQVIGSTGNLPGWEGTKIKKYIEGRIVLPVHVENDANTAAYGEAKAAGFENKTCSITVTLGTGIGGGIVLGGKLYRGAHWAAGEIGHIRIGLDNRRLCTCGLFDCWEAYASGRGFRMTAQEVLSGVSPEHSQLAAIKADELTNEAVVDAATAGDIMAQKIVNTWHEHICSGLAGLAHTLDPDCFFISGGMSKFVDYELIKELLVDRTLPRIGESVEVRPAALGLTAGLIGAGQLVLDELIASART